MSRVYSLLAILAVIGTVTGGAYLKGHSDGRSVEAAAQRKATDKLNTNLREAKTKLAALEAKRLAEVEELSQEVDELRRQAHEDPNASRPAFGASSVRRLNALR